MPRSDIHSFIQVFSIPLNFLLTYSLPPSLVHLLTHPLFSSIAQLSAHSFMDSLLCSIASSLLLTHTPTPSLPRSSFMHCLPTSPVGHLPAAPVPSHFSGCLRHHPTSGQPRVPPPCPELPSQPPELLGPGTAPSSPVFHWITKLSHLQNPAHTSDCGAGLSIGLASKPKAHKNPEPGSDDGCNIRGGT